MYGYKAKQNCNLSKNEFLAFKQNPKPECKRNNIVFCKPDKSNGIVVLDTFDYKYKINTILSDHSKLKPLDNDPNEKRELASKDILKSKACYQMIFTLVYVCRIYCLPKLYKPAVPLGPFVSAAQWKAIPMD